METPRFQNAAFLRSLTAEQIKLLRGADLVALGVRASDFFDPTTEYPDDPDHLRRLQEAHRLRCERVAARIARPGSGLKEILCRIRPGWGRHQRRRQVQ